MIKESLPADAFDALADDYERFRIGYSSELYAALEPFGFRRGAHVLDAGCGTGLAAAPLIARGLTVTGIDCSPAMLGVAERRLPEATLQLASVEALPFAPATFDAALSAHVFHHVDADAAFAELVRVVKPGGAVAVWWKMLGSDDPMRAARATAAERAGVSATADPLRGGFGAFYRAPFAERSLRVLPFTARFSLEEWMGYERSRLSVHNGYGERRGAYLDALQNELLQHGAAGGRIAVRYTQYCYVGVCAR